MHTMGRNPDGTHWVGRMEHHEGHDSLLVMFNKISFGSALWLVSTLNGGGYEAVSETTLRALEYCQV